MMPAIMKRSVWCFLVVFAVGLSVLLCAANLYLGNLNQDEGWYLYAAKQVAQGSVLYRDFMFTQGPVLPCLYGVLYSVVEKFGVAGGRLITACFGLAAAGCAAWLAARAASRQWRAASFCAFVLVGLNVYQSYFTTIVKTYSVCAFFLTAGFVALSYAGGRRGLSCSFWGGVLLALAACTRLSAGIVLPIAGIWLIWNRNKVAGGSADDPSSGFHLSALPAWVWFGLGGGSVLAVGLVPFFLLAPENTHFALFGYHAGRSPGGLAQMLALKGGFVSRFVQAYFLFSMGCVAAFFFRRRPHSISDQGGGELELNTRPHLTELLCLSNRGESLFAHSFVSLLWLAGAAITLVHFMAPFPYDDYQTIVYPLLAAALVATLVPRCPEKFVTQVLLTVLLASLAASFSSSINQDWMIRGRDRIWWKFKETSDLAALQAAGAQVRTALGWNGLLLTQDTYLAVEAGADVPKGMEMGPFSYYPGLSRADAEKLHLMNEEMLLELISEGTASIAAFSGYGLSIRSPEVSELTAEEQGRLRTALLRNYHPTASIPHFGQAHTTLNVFELN